MIKQTNIKGFMLSAVKQRRKLMAKGKSLISSPTLKNDLATIEAYAEELNQQSRLAQFYFNNYAKIMRIVPPTWHDKAHEIYNECRELVQA